jgi:pimeloyl-ACP methyl ester carboxylesterase
VSDAHTRRVVASDGVGIHVEERGAGRPVVLVQGLGYAAWAWEPQAAAVGRVARAVVMDNRGAGRSDKPPAPYSIEQMADDVASVVESCGGGPAAIVGASMGGYIAMTLAVRHPRLVDALVLVATLTGGPGSIGVPESTLAAWAAHAHLPSEEFARATMPISLSPGWVEAHPAEFERLLAARLEHPTPPETWRAQWDACERFLRVGVPDGDITVPTWVVHGTADRVVPYENAALVRTRIPQAEVVTVRGGGHLCWLERPHALNRLLVEVATRRS